MNAENASLDQVSQRKCEHVVKRIDRRRLGSNCGTEEIRCKKNHREPGRAVVMVLLATIMVSYMKKSVYEKHKSSIRRLKSD